MVESRKAETAARAGEGSGRATLEDLYRQIQAGQAKELRIILKADVSGSLGAITHALDQLEPTRCGSTSSTRAPATSPTTTSCWRPRRTRSSSGSTPRSPRRPAGPRRAEGVDVRLYDIIYKLTDDIDAALKGLLEPEVVEVVEGRAEVRQVFRVGKQPRSSPARTSPTAGSSAAARASGAAARSSRPTGSSRCGASATTSARSWPNFECGIGLANFHDLEEGDVIECFSQQTVSRDLRAG